MENQREEREEMAMKMSDKQFNELREFLKNKFGIVEQVGIRYHLERHFGMDLEQISEDQAEAYALQLEEEKDYVAPRPKRRLKLFVAASVGVILVGLVVGLWLTVSEQRMTTTQSAPTPQVTPATVPTTAPAVSTADEGRAARMDALRKGMMSPK